MTGAAVATFLVPALLASAQSAGAVSGAPAADDIRYVSSDLRHVAVFSKDSARFGPRLALSPDWGSSPARYLDSPDGVRCVSVGRPGNTEEFAVKRPLKAQESYKCLTTAFRVVHCFEGCRAAVVERVSQAGGHARGTRRSHMYVDGCAGVVAFSSAGNLIEAIPAQAELLRGKVGILADRDRPDCRGY